MTSGLTQPPIKPDVLDSQAVAVAANCWVFCKNLLRVFTFSADALPVPGNLDHECPVCNARFSSGGHLKQHLRLHEGQQMAEQRHNILAEMVKNAFGEFRRLSWQWSSYWLSGLCQFLHRLKALSDLNITLDGSAYLRWKRGYFREVYFLANQNATDSILYHCCHLRAVGPHCMAESHILRLVCKHDHRQILCLSTA